MEDRRKQTEDIILETERGFEEMAGCMWPLIKVDSLHRDTRAETWMARRQVRGTESVKQGAWARKELRGAGVVQAYVAGSRTKRWAERKGHGSE